MTTTEDKLALSSMKDDDDIMDFLGDKDSDEDYSLFKLTISKLKEPSNILELLGNFSVDNKREIFKSALEKFEEADDDDIKSFLESTDYDDEFCKKLVPKMKDTQEILEVLGELDFEENKQTYKSLIPTFEDADEEDIMSFLEQTGHDPETCKKLFPKLSTSNILEVLENIEFEDNKELYKSIVSLFEESDDDEEIKSFIVFADYDSEICKKLLPKMKEISEIIEVLDNVEFENNKEIYNSLVFKFKESDDDDIKSFFEKAGYDSEICKKLLPEMSSDSAVAELLDELDFDDNRQLFEDCVSIFEEADDDDIKSFLDASGFDGGFCKKLIPKMENISEILDSLDGLTFDGIEELYNLLVSKFEDADDDDIKSFLDQSDHDVEICKSLVPKIEDDSEVLDVLSNIDFGTHGALYQILISRFQDAADEDIKSFLEETGYDVDFARKLLPFVDDEDIKVEILEEVSELKDVPLSKEEAKRGLYVEEPKQNTTKQNFAESIFNSQSLTVSTPSYKEVVSISHLSSGSSGLELGDLKGKSDDQLIIILKENENNSEVYNHYLEILPFEEWTDYRISTFLERLHYSLEICIRLIPCIKSDYNLDSKLDKFPEDPRIFQVLIPRLGLHTRSEFQLVSLLERTKYSLEFCKVCISFLSSKEKIFTVMEKTRYNEDVCILGLNRLRSFLPKS